MEADDNYEVIPTLKIQDVINCKVSNWYELFKDHCLKLDIIKLNKAFIDYLKADGIILPNECINDEDKEEEEEYVGFPHLSNEINNTIKKFKKVIPKINLTTPIDVKWIKFDHSIECDNIDDIYLLLKASDFIIGEITGQPFENCIDFDAYSENEMEYELVLKEFKNFNKSQEFRLFIRDHTLIGISQRDLNFYEHFQSFEFKSNLKNRISEFFNVIVKNKFYNSNYILDIIIDERNEIYIIDFNVYDTRTDSKLFGYEELLHDFKSNNLQVKVIDVDDSNNINNLYSTSSLQKEFL